MRAESRSRLSSAISGVPARGYGGAAAVICGGLILFLCLGQRHSFGLFLAPMTADLHWGRESFAFAIALQNLVWGLAGPFTGWVADRYGAGRVLAAGALCYAAGLFLMPLSGDALSFALSAGVLVGLGQSGTGFGIVYGAIGRAVAPARRSSALGLAGALGGLGQFAMLPWNHALIGHLGWAAALIALSASVALMLPLAFGCVERGAPPSGPGQSAGDALVQALGHPGFLLLVLGFLACGFQLAFIATHLPAYLLDNGLNARVGVIALALVALFNIAGTWIFGSMGDRLRKKYLLSGLYLGRGAVILVYFLLPVSAASTYAFAAAMGFLWLGTAPLTNGLVGQIFGVRYLSMLFGIVFLGHQIGSFLGVWLGGWLFDRSGSYAGVWLIALGLSLIAALLHLPIDDRSLERSPGSARPAHA